LCYNFIMSNRLRGFLILLIGLLWLPRQSANAQGNTGALLSALDVQAFPLVQAYLEVHDAQGNFVHGLTADQVVMIEDGNPRPVAVLRELTAGSQVVIAINPGPSFAIRNNKAISRYDLIKEALRQWALSRMGSNIDDLSLLITKGPAASHTSDPAKWLSVLESEQIDARTAVQDLDTLFRAVSLASDPTPRPGMSRAVIFITPPPEGQIDQSLESLAAQAREQQIAIYVWLVSSSGAFVTQSAQQLRSLSEATGGKTLNFTGEEALPGLEEYLAPLRYIYTLEYESAVSTSGAHQVIAQIQAAEASIETPVRSFEIELQPPVPAFVSPPLQIQRDLTPPKEQQKSANAPEDAASHTQQQTIQVVFDFPDGRMRPLVYSALLVNGSVVAENTQPPFDRFLWDLSAYESDSVQRLQVQARDKLGLTGVSVEIPVQIIVRRPEQNALSSFQRSLPILSALAALSAGAVLLLVLVVGGKLRPRTLRAARQRRKYDPVTQPVQIRAEPPAARRSNWTNRFQWPGKAAAPKAEAYLNPLPDSDQEDTLPPIPISDEEIILGSDPGLASLVFDDASVEALHARLLRLQDGSYRLADMGSVAGTWINYTPVSKEGARLEHGDLIHIGRIGFRFTLRKPLSKRKPVIVTQPLPQSPLEEKTE
jgi:hypothetical protein